MIAYVLTFIAAAVFPTALAAIGGHLATSAVPDDKKKRKLLILVWVLACCGVLFAALQQIDAYHSDTEHDSKITNLQSTLNTSLQSEAYMRGQLETIAATIGKLGEKSSDPVTAELASAVAKMAGGVKRLLQNSVR